MNPERTRGRLAWRKSRAWRTFRLVWVGLGLAFIAYMALSFSAWGVDRAVLESDADVEVSIDDRTMAFIPRGRDTLSGVVFIPGGLVAPKAYAPLLRSIADAGRPAILVKLPDLGGRHAMGDDGRDETVRRVLSVLAEQPGQSPWLVAGHSLGGAIAARVAARDPARMGALALLGTTHPRDFSLAHLDIPVTRVYGTRDGIAPVDRMRANAANLPTGTEWVAIEGGNHSRFGYYGFQIGDRRATISREEQQAEVLAALLAAIPD